MPNKWWTYWRLNFAFTSLSSQSSLSFSISDFNFPTMIVSIIFLKILSENTTCSELRYYRQFISLDSALLFLLFFLTLTSIRRGLTLSIRAETLCQSYLLAYWKLLVLGRGRWKIGGKEFPHIPCTLAVPDRKAISPLF